MSFYMGRIPRFIEDRTTIKLQQKIFSLQLAMQQKLEIINIYESSTGAIICWYFHDTKVLPLSDVPAPLEDEPPKPVKKARRKNSG